MISLPVLNPCSRDCILVSEDNCVIQTFLIHIMEMREDQVDKIHDHLYRCFVSFILIMSDNY
jgi:hypothetical protein